MLCSNPGCFRTGIGSTTRQSGDHLYYGGYNLAAAPLDGVIGRVRISDATADTAWNPGYRPRVSTLVVDANHEWVYVGGGDEMFHGLSRISATTGMVDPDWRPLAVLQGSSTRIDAMFLASDGDIYISGSFDGVSCDPSRTVNVLRLIDGQSIDPTWHVDTDINYLGVNALFEASDGKVAVGGSFATINGVLSPGFAVVDGTTDVIFMDEIGDPMCIP